MEITFCCWAKEDDNIVDIGEHEMSLERWKLDFLRSLNHIWSIPWSKWQLRKRIKSVVWYKAGFVLIIVFNLHVPKPDVCSNRRDDRSFAEKCIHYIMRSIGYTSHCVTALNVRQSTRKRREHFFFFGSTTVGCLLFALSRLDDPIRHHLPDSVLFHTRERFSPPNTAQNASAFRLLGITRFDISRNVFGPGKHPNWRKGG